MNAEEQRPQSPTVALALVDSVASDQIADLGGDTLEVALDALLDEGVLKDIPVFGSVLKIFRAGVSIKEALFVRKLRRFLLGAARVDVEERTRFTEKMNADPAYKAKVGEKLLVTIDRLDDIEKAQLLADAFSGYITGRFDYKLFCSLASAIDRLILAYVDDFQQIYWLANRLVDGFDERCAQLQTCDLLRPSRAGFGGVTLEDMPWSTSGHVFFRNVLPKDNHSLRRNFVLSLQNLVAQDSRLDAAYAATEFTPEDASAFILHLPDEDFFGIKVLPGQVNGPANAWFLRRLEKHRFQCLRRSVI